MTINRIIEQFEAAKKRVDSVAKGSELIPHFQSKTTTDSYNEGEGVFYKPGNFLVYSFKGHGELRPATPTEVLDKYTFYGFEPTDLGLAVTEATKILNDWYQVHRPTKTNS
ncbi:MAG: hypothetical protein ACMXYF_01160 [Candidatus Woesearchaeota archaeon]